MFGSGIRSDRLRPEVGRLTGRSVTNAHAHIVVSKPTVPVLLILIHVLALARNFTYRLLTWVTAWSSEVEQLVAGSASMGMGWVAKWTVGSRPYRQLQACYLTLINCCLFTLLCRHVFLVEINHYLHRVYIKTKRGYCQRSAMACPPGRLPFLNLLEHSQSVVSATPSV